MKPIREPTQPTASRSLAAIALLEQLQRREGRISGEERREEEDPRVLREIAERQLMAERLDAQPPMSPEKMREALVDLVGSAEYAREVERKAAAIEQYYSENDGDRWSRYERPDRRRRLGELVVRIEQGAAKCGYEISRRPVVGTLPTYDVNARAISGPPGEGHLVVFDSGMFNFSTLLGRTAGQAIDARPGSDGASLTFNPQRLYRERGYDRALIRQWADLLFSQTILGTCAYCEMVQVAPEHAPFADQLREAIDTFILAHEYGHVILGHTDLYGSGRSLEPEEAHAQEFAADGVAFAICKAWGGSLWACLGASVFFYGREGADLAANVFLTGEARGSASSTHPAAAARRRTIMQVSETVDANAVRVSRDIYEALGKMTGYLLPAFAEAHRQGFPEAGYRPASEYEKAAAFETFWRAGIAIQEEQNR